MVDSGVYDCQFVLVVKLAAVLNASAGSTGPRCCGLNGRRCCSRSIPYVPSNPNKLNASSENAYTGQVCSRAGSTPERRYRTRSARPSTAGSGCRVPSNTRNMYAPSGRVSASTTTKKSAICIHPMAVISEPFRPEQRVAEVDGEEHREREPDAVFEAHGAPPRRAQKRTYAHEPAKNATLASTSRKSIMPRCDAPAMPESVAPPPPSWRPLPACASCGMQAAAAGVVAGCKVTRLRPRAICTLACVWERQTGSNIPEKVCRMPEQIEK